MSHVAHPFEEIRAAEQAPCSFCGRHFQVTELPEHCETCEITSARISHPSDFSHGPRPSDRFPIYRPPERPISELAHTRPDRIKCMSCLQDITPNSFHKHIKMCGQMLLGDISRLRGFISNMGDIDWPSAYLTREQRAAIDHVLRTSKQFSDEANKSLLARIESLGFTKDDLDRTLKWVKLDAPIVIHVFLDEQLSYLMNDTHYRNQFETGTSHGSRDLSARRRWEEGIFNGKYKNGKDADRVKYAVMNILDDPDGVYNCRRFGDSYFILRHVRLRTSFSSINVQPQVAKLASCDHFQHILNEYNDKELRVVIEVATRKQRWSGSRDLRFYKEVQIHGPILLSEHIEHVTVSGRHKDDKYLLEMIERFVAKNKCTMSRMW